MFSFVKELDKKYYLYFALFFMVLSLLTHTSLFSLGCFSGFGLGMYFMKK